MAMGRKLRRSKDSVVFGVLGGLAEYMDTDPTLVRVIYSMLTVFTAFSGVITVCHPVVGDASCGAMIDNWQSRLSSWICQDSIRLRQVCDIG